MTVPQGRFKSCPKEMNQGDFGKSKGDTKVSPVLCWAQRGDPNLMLPERRAVLYCRLMPPSSP